jgi:hypothetical protein
MTLRRIAAHDSFFRNARTPNAERRKHFRAFFWYLRENGRGERIKRSAALLPAPPRFFAVEVARLAWIVRARFAIS